MNKLAVHGPTNRGAMKLETRRMSRSAAVLLLIALAAELLGCAGNDDPCAPLSGTYACFEPTSQALRDHAVTDASTVLDIPKDSLVAGQPTQAAERDYGATFWVVPITANGKTRAVVLFERRSDTEVSGGDVTSYDPPRDSFPTPGAGQHLLLVDNPVCQEYVPPLPTSCLLRGYSWEIVPNAG